MRPEDRIHISICDFIRLQYPDVIFTSESSGMRLTIGQASKLARMRSGSKLADIWIAEPRGSYCGLFLEVKAETPYKKDGELKKSDHLKAQSKMLERLVKKGYQAMFIWSLEQGIVEIRKYMKLKK